MWKKDIKSTGTIHQQSTCDQRFDCCKIQNKSLRLIEVREHCIRRGLFSEGLLSYQVTRVRQNIHHSVNTEALIICSRKNI